MSDAPDRHAPPTDLDVPAARLAERRYRCLVERGVPKWQAWEEAVALFACHHPSWPVPLAEREAARAIGTLILNQLAGAAIQRRPSANRVPLDLLVDLATPETPERVRAALRVETMGVGAVSIFRGAWRFRGNLRPVTGGRSLDRTLTGETAMRT